MTLSHPRHAEILRHWAKHLLLPEDAFEGTGTRYFFQDDYLINRRIKLYKMREDKTVVLIPESLRSKVDENQLPTARLMDEAALHQAIPNVKFRLRWRDVIYYLHPDHPHFDQRDWGNIHAMTEADAAEFDDLKAACSEDDIRRAIISMDDPQLIGYYDSNRLVGVASFLYENDVADIGVLVHPDFRSRGIASKMAQYLANVGLEQGKIIQYMTEEVNPGSMGVARKSGFMLYVTEEGYELVSG